jgi:hypothetical protein
VSDRESPKPLEFTTPPASEPQTPGIQVRNWTAALTQLSMRAKFAMSFGVAAIALAAMIIFVNGHNTDASGGLPISPAAQAQDNRLAAILASQDQAPHVVHTPAGVSGLNAIATAVRARMVALINLQEAIPPLEAPRCETTLGPGARRGFFCTIIAGGQYFNFVGILDPPARTVTLCRHDPPQPGSGSVPLNARCLIKAK